MEPQIYISLSLKLQVRLFVVFAGVLAVSSILSGCAMEPVKTGNNRSHPLVADILISGGMVYTGEKGRQGFVSDVAIRAERIVFVGRATPDTVDASQVIDATGLIVAPGFIDPHTHADGDLFSDKAERRLNANYLMQGVTTVFVGNDGDGSSDVQARKDRVAKAGIGTNVAFLVGHGAVREHVIGLSDRAPTASELTAMKKLVADAMCQGAFGFSAGLYYTPQNFATTDEVVALAQEAARRGGYYDTHIRDESSYSIGLLGAISEALEIGRRSGAPTHISHIKALGADVWGASDDVVTLIEDAQAKGQKVTADQYPWLASGTRISNALLPAWVLDGGLKAARQRFANTGTLENIKAEMADNLRRRGGAETILITRMVGGDTAYENTTLKDVADTLKISPIDAAIAILKAGDAQIASFNMQEADVETFMKRPWVLTGSDGSGGHPRKYGTFPHKFEKYVADKHLITISDFVYRSAGLAAESFGLDQRGFIRSNYIADIVVFDPEKFRAKADYAHPEVLSEGVVDLLVNGNFAVRNEKVMPVFAGTALSSKALADSKLCEK